MNSIVGHVLTVGYNAMKTILSSSDGGSTAAGSRGEDDDESIEKKYYTKKNPRYQPFNRLPPDSAYEILLYLEGHQAALLSRTDKFLRAGGPRGAVNRICCYSVV